MPPAVPICPSERPSPELGSVSTAATLPTIVTSKPSRIHVIPKAKITSQCQRLNGSRSILAGTWLSTVCVTAPPSLNLSYLLLQSPSQKRGSPPDATHRFRVPPRGVSTFLTPLR